MSSVVRVPDTVLTEAKRIAALQGTQPGDILATAWREYLDNHRAEFAGDLERAAELLRNGTLDDLAAFASRNAKERARAAHEAADAS